MLLSRGSLRPAALLIRNFARCHSYESRVSHYSLVSQAKTQLFMYRDTNAAFEILKKAKALPDQTNRILTYETNLFHAVCAQLNGEPQVAEEFQQILSEYPTCKYSHMGMVQEYMKKGDEDAIFKSLIKVLRLDPKYPRARILLSQLLINRFHQYELGTAHAYSAIKQSTNTYSSSHQFNLISEIEGDSSFLSTQQTKSSQEDVLMNCPSLYYSINRDYEETYSFYSQSMLTVKEDIPSVFIHSEPFSDIGVNIPNYGFISSKISPAEIQFHCKSNISPNTSLRRLIAFSDKVKKASDVVILANADHLDHSVNVESGLFGKLKRVCPSSKPTKPIRTVPFSPEGKSFAEIWYQWIDICREPEAATNPFAVKRFKDCNIPYDWKVYTDEEFLRGEEEIYDKAHRISPLHSNATCNGCGHTVPGLLAANYAYHAKHKCDKCEYGNYIPNYQMPEKRGNVEVTLLEKIAVDIWKTDAIIVVGELAKFHPWVDLLRIAEVRDIPVAVFDSDYPKFLTKCDTICTDPVVTLAHFLKEKQYKE